jgi:hypothetical protein
LSERSTLLARPRRTRVAFDFANVRKGVDLTARALS